MPPEDRTQSARDAYRFLAAQEGEFVTYQQISDATGGVWSVGTVGNYRSKKWKNLVVREGRVYRVRGVALMTEHEFVGLQSQVREAVIDPRVQVIQDALAVGEGQRTEFKAQVPRTASELATEVASFATSGGGMILIGVDDGGAVVGYEGNKERIEGIIQNVAPVPTATVDLVPYREKQIALVRVLGGPEPLYFANDRPYLRQGTLSRPATPAEVMTIYRQYFQHG